MKLRKDIYFVLYLCTVSPRLLLGQTTREDILNRANQYLNVSWICKEQNIIDKYDHTVFQNYYSNGHGKEGSDQKDDRRFKWRWTEDETKGVWEESDNNWPFSTGTVVDGEAYAFSQNDDTALFNSKITHATEEWIAGRREEDSYPPGGIYDGYAGLDCSGFLGNCMGLGSYHSTLALLDLCIPVAPDQARKGDFLFYTDPVRGRHMVMLGSERFPGDSGQVNIYHSATWRYQESEHVRHVVSEQTSFKMISGQLYLNWESLPETEEQASHAPYSPFLQFADI